MTSVGTITFHASHNYGSMLQAYALQRTILGLGRQNKIINLRTPIQREFYDDHLYSTFPWRPDPGRIARWALSLPHRPRLNRKYTRFENFLERELVTTDEYASQEEIVRDCECFEVYLAGSDQIWNTECVDFDWAYYLPFVGEGRKVSYAVSLGPDPENPHNRANKRMIGGLLADFARISVREESGADFVADATGLRPCVSVDPTLLPDTGHWIRKTPGRLCPEPYILFYAPFYNRTSLDYAIGFAKANRRRLISTVFHYQNLFIRGISGMYDAGPWEFLSLVRHADVVITGSFHALIFSLLFHTPCLAINGAHDSRMRNILEKTDLTLLATDPSSGEYPSLCELSRVDFSASDRAIEVERQNGIEYLKQILKP